jgi:hypothetical protein
MAKSAPTPRLIQCYHCRHRFEVGAKTMTTSCPGCNKPLMVEDVVVKGLEAVRKLQTCGRIVVQKKGRVIAQLVEAHLGIEVDGVVEAGAFQGGPVRIGEKGEWKGDCRAPVLHLEAGGRIHGGFFTIPDDSLGLSSLPVATENGRK